MTEELWSPVVGYEELYAVSSLGKVYSLKREKPLRPSILKDGYFGVGLHGKGKPKLLTIHRLIGEAFIPNPYNLPQVHHKDGNKKHNYLCNLEWATPRRNTHLNYLELGLVSSKRSLSKEQVLEIDRQLKEGKTVKGVSIEFGVNYQVIHSISIGKNYASITKRKGNPSKKAARHQKLNWEQVKEIREIFTQVNHPTTVEIAERYNVSRSAISGVINHYSWNRV